MMVDSRSVVVIGGRHAGGAMALALRELGATRAVTIVGEEQGSPVPRGDRVVLDIHDDRLAGIVCLDRPKDFLVARRANTTGQSVDAKRAADPAVDLRKCVLTHTGHISRAAS
jgi:2-polyprenyl-6-methoxyphenol hydroxylase-like FAD-dependent oxidoreductase